MTTGWLLGWCASAALAGDPPRGPDLDGDGYEDLVIGHPYEGVNGEENAGATLFLYGSATGLERPLDRATGWWQDLGAVEGASAVDEGFGAALAWGDFDGDCYDDVLVGVPGTTVDGYAEAGLAQVFYGSPTGPSDADDVGLHRSTASMDGSPSTEAMFGSAVAVGDFDGDGYDDAAIGAPDNPLLHPTEKGTVQIVYGSWVGLSPTAHRADQLLYPGVSGIDAPSSSYSRFGGALATGDFDCDGYADLAISVSREVRVLYGSAAGLSASATRPDQTWSQAVPELQGDHSAYDTFGTSLTVGWFMDPLVVGNFDGNSHNGHSCDDLAIGVPTESTGTVLYGGAIQILYGTSTSGLQATSPDDDLYTEDSSGVDGSAEFNGAFGATLAVGRFDGDAYDDLAITTLKDDESGVVHVLRGSSTGVTTASDALWDRADVGGVVTADDQFGRGLSSGDFDGDGTAELIIGIPLAEIASIDDSGFFVEVGLTGATPPAIASHHAWIEEDVSTIVSEEDDWFGSVFAPARSTPLACVPKIGGPGGFKP